MAATMVPCPLAPNCLTGAKNHKPGTKSLKNCQDVASGKKKREDFQTRSNPVADFAKNTAGMSASDVDGSSARIDKDGNLFVRGLSYKDGTMAKTLKVEIENGIHNITEDPEAMAEYLSFAASAYNYSHNNLMLLMLQKRNGTVFRTKKQWMALGYKPKDNAMEAIIRRPIFIRDKNYDFTKTNEDGKPINPEDNPEAYIMSYKFYGVLSDKDMDPTHKEVPLHPAIKRMNESKTDPTRDPMTDMADDLKTVAKQMGVTIKYGNSETGELGLDEAKGGYAQKTDDGYLIVLDGSPSTTQRAQAETLAHEMGHILSGHLDGDARNYAKKQHRADIEMEAETFAYSLSRAYGADPEDAGARSYTYINSWESASISEDNVAKAVDKATQAMSKFAEHYDKAVTGETENDRRNKANEIAKKNSESKRKTRTKSRR